MELKNTFNQAALPLGNSSSNIAKPSENQGMTHTPSATP